MLCDIQSYIVSPGLTHKIWAKSVRSNIDSGPKIMESSIYLFSVSSIKMHPNNENVGDHLWIIRWHNKWLADFWALYHIANSFSGIYGAPNFLTWWIDRLESHALLLIIMCVRVVYALSTSTLKYRLFTFNRRWFNAFISRKCHTQKYDLLFFKCNQFVWLNNQMNPFFVPR